MADRTASRSAEPGASAALRPTPAIMLALVGGVALPPLAIDMYLPSLPEISAVFETPEGIAQLSLTAFLLMLGIGQLIGGPLTDAIGRKRPMLLGLGIFVIGSVLAALSPSIEVLLAARVVQGIGGALAVVVANSSVRDFSSGDGATRLYALMMGAVGIAPVIAPTVGGFVDTALGWRAVFGLLAVLGLAMFISVVVSLPESLPPEKRSPMRLRSVFGVYGSILRNRRFMLPAVALVAMFGLLFAYIGGASYVYQSDYGISVAAFGVAFGAAGLFMVVATLAVNRLSAWADSTSLALTGTGIATAGAIGGIVLVLLEAPFLVFLASILVLLFGLGMTEPALMGAAMSASDRGMGQAAAVLGAAQFLLGAVATTIAGFVAAEGPLPWMILLAALALMALVLTALSARTRSRRPTPVS